MARPGERMYRVIRRFESDGETVVTGQVLANFTISTYSHPGTSGGSWASYSASPAITEIGGGRYGIAVDAPAAAGWFHIDIETDDTDVLSFTDWGGEIESQDLDSIAVNVLSPQATITSNLQIGTTVTTTLVAHRYRSITFSIVDENGDGIDLTSPNYNNFQFTISKEDHSAVWNGIANGGTVSEADGSVTITIPEDAAFHSWLADDGTSSMKIFFELVADQDEDTAKTVPIIRSSQWSLSRREVGVTP